MKNFKLKILILLVFPFVSVYAYDTSENEFSYSLVFNEKRCNKVPDRIKKGLSKAISVGYNGFKILKQDSYKKALSRIENM